MASQDGIEPLMVRLASSNFPIQVLYESASGAGSSQLTRLMLNSDAIEQRRARPWQHKSLAHQAEEDFVRLDPTNYLFDGNAKWLVHAEQCFADSLRRWWWRQERGLILYVGSGKETYRAARAGDSPYALCVDWMKSGCFRT